MKSISTTVITLIACVILIMAMLFVIWPWIPKVLGIDIGGIFGGISTKEFSVEEKAILCAYYRCKEGCKEEAEKYCEDRISACVLPQLLGFSSDGKICDWNSIQFPVEIENKGGEISKSRLKEEFNELDCIVWPGFTGQTNLDAIQNDLLLVDKNGVVDAETKKCDIRGVLQADWQTDAYEKFKIKTDVKKLFIFNNDFHSSVAHYWRVFINYTPSYIALEKGESVEEEFEAGVWYENYMPGKLYRLSTIEDGNKKEYAFNISLFSSGWYEYSNSFYCNPPFYINGTIIYQDEQTKKAKIEPIPQLKENENAQFKDLNLKIEVIKISQQCFGMENDIITKGAARLKISYF